MIRYCCYSVGDGPLQVYDNVRARIVPAFEAQELLNLQEEEIAGLRAKLATEIALRKKAEEDLADLRDASSRWTCWPREGKPKIVFCCTGITVKVAEDCVAQHGQTSEPYLDVRYKEPGAIDLRIEPAPQC